MTMPSEILTRHRGLAIGMLLVCILLLIPFLLNSRTSNTTPQNELASPRQSAEGGTAAQQQRVTEVANTLSAEAIDTDYFYLWFDQTEQRFHAQLYGESREGAMRLVYDYLKKEGIRDPETLGIHFIGPFIPTAEDFFPEETSPSQQGL